ncbi:hypothetical protein UC8_09050 [Roseimaritima ulvae]|uniref:Uncharacterized protein n=2 Tax=Roseimaritima ulvae TaxID=980254 RepID=A0A5B9QN94_9BACT|nr:hypothetical protein UC8_09050 [Roseimaritima ulvae]
MRKTMKRTIPLACLAAATLTSLANGPQATAGEWWDNLKHEMHVVYHRNNAWPQPFAELSAAQTRAPFEVMKQKGWLLHNTIGHELFRDGDGALTAAGRNRVHWIATQAPANHRVVHVLRGASEAETEARVEAVRVALNHMYISGPQPPVYITEIQPATSPGMRASQISRAAMTNMPAPKLPASNSSTGGDGS